MSVDYLEILLTVYFLWLSAPFPPHAGVLSPSYRHAVRLRLKIRPFKQGTVFLNKSHRSILCELLITMNCRLWRRHILFLLVWIGDSGLRTCASGLPLLWSGLSQLHTLLQLRVFAGLNPHLVLAGRWASVS